MQVWHEEDHVLRAFGLVVKVLLPLPEPSVQRHFCFGTLPTKLLVHGEVVVLGLALVIVAGHGFFVLQT